MSEINQKKCKVCGELKHRIRFGQFPGNPANKRWVDDTGKQWSGLTCPDCHRKQTLVRMHRLRGKV